MIMESFCSFAATTHFASWTHVFNRETCTITSAAKILLELVTDWFLHCFNWLILSRLKLTYSKQMASEQSRTFFAFAIHWGQQCKWEKVQNAILGEFQALTGLQSLASQRSVLVECPRHNIYYSGMHLSPKRCSQKWGRRPWQMKREFQKSFQPSYSHAIRGCRAFGGEKH